MGDAEERALRVGLNEAVFRRVNEQLEALASEFRRTDAPLDLVCECGDPSCVERITMSREEYEQLRSDGAHFAVFPGHDLPDVEDVVANHGGYEVVRKHEGEPAELAERTDPRS